MTNNELSRKVLKTLVAKSGSMRFKELVETLGTDARALFKNLFFLEEKGFLQLSTSYPPESVYPQIHLVRLRKRGEDAAKDPARLDSAFPLSDDTTDTRLHIPPELNHTLTFHKALDLLAARVRQNLAGDDRDAALEKIESLLQLPFSHEAVPLEAIVPEKP